MGIGKGIHVKTYTEEIAVSSVIIVYGEFTSTTAEVAWNAIWLGVWLSDNQELLSMRSLSIGSAWSRQV
jgi:hypothetical protein